MVSMADKNNEIVKSLKEVDGLLDVMKAEFLDGSKTKEITNVKIFSSGKGTGDVPKPSMKGSMVDGAETTRHEQVQLKGGSGAGVGGKFVGMNQTGSKFNDGAKDKEVMKKSGKPKK